MTSNRINVLNGGILPPAKERDTTRGLLLALLPLLLGQAVSMAFAQTTPPQLALKPVDLKLLVLAGNGTEPSFLAIQTFLNQIGVPHDDVILAAPGRAAVALPALNDSSKGFYQGIILATGNLAVCNAAGACGSALPDAGWAALDAYAAAFGIRTVSYYTYPNARYGLAPVSAVSIGATASNLSFSPGAAPIFPYLNTKNPLKITYTYAYLSAPVSAPGEVTTPILTMPGGTVGVVHKKADGREYLALTFDNNPNLIHSLALGYGVINWVTKGVFLGSRQVYLTPQVDDLFIANELYDAVTAGCKPSGFLVDPTVDLGSVCQNDQVSGADVIGLANWQSNIQVNPQTKGFQVTMAFNGLGATDDDGLVDLTDDLTSTASINAGKFNWVSHTFNHLNLDCYSPVPNSGVCRRATLQESGTEIDSNIYVARTLNLNFDGQSMVTPEISGLNNPEFIKAAVQRGIKYLIIDSSTLTANPPPHNTGIPNKLDSSILMIPRRPTSIFYNVSSPDIGVAGSLPDEYNYFYGPQGLLKIGGAGGAPFYATNQTYNQIMDQESNSLLMDMLRFKADPIMFHQSNLVRYDDVNSLFTDIMSRTLNKFMSISTLPVASMSEAAIGQLYNERMDYNASGVKATWYPGPATSITLTSTRGAMIPITGFCMSGCPAFGGQTIRKVSVTPGSPVTVTPNVIRSSNVGL